MLALFFKYSRHCLLALLLLLGLACGHLAATLLGVSLVRGTRPQGPPPAATRSAAAVDPATDFGIILQHNLFNPAARSTSPVSFSLQAGGDDEMATRGDLELLGTVVAGSRSLAIIRIGGEVKNYHLDAEITGGRVEEILRKQVTIRNNDNSLTVLRLQLEGAAERAAAVQSSSPATRTVSVQPDVPSSSRAQSPSAATSRSAVDPVRSAGANRWIIPRRTAEAARENVGEQLRSALFQPNLVNGKTDGFVIRSIQPGTLLAQMGLQRGDIVKRVNRMPLDSPEKGLQIMQQLREARQITVDLERAGKPLSFAYEIE